MILSLPGEGWAHSLLLRKWQWPAGRATPIGWAQAPGPCSAMGWWKRNRATVSRRIAPLESGALLATRHWLASHVEREPAAAITGRPQLTLVMAKGKHPHPGDLKRGRKASPQADQRKGEAPEEGQSNQRRQGAAAADALPDQGHQSSHHQQRHPATHQGRPHRPEPAEPRPIRKAAAAGDGDGISGRLRCGHRGLRGDREVGKARGGKGLSFTHGVEHRGGWRAPPAPGAKAPRGAQAPPGGDTPDRPPHQRSQPRRRPCRPSRIPPPPRRSS